MNSRGSDQHQRTAVFGRPDEERWVAAMDKKVIKIFGMGTWEIVDASEILEGCNVMNTCFLFKVIH